MARKVMINQATRRTAARVVQNILKPTYFNDGVPINELADELKDMGIVMLMEDNTEWSGFFCGLEGECFIRLAPMTTESCGFFTPYENTGLRLTWYKCTSRQDRKFEVIGYIS